MKRMHVHVAVSDLQQSIGFYSALFDAEPAVVKPDYAKWMLDDPRVNFAISTRGREPGLDHLGIQVEDKTELQEVYARLRKAGARSSSRAKPYAAMPSRRSPGSTRRLSIRPGKASTMATARASAWRVSLMRRRVVRPSNPLRRRLLLHAASEQRREIDQGAAEIPNLVSSLSRISLVIGKKPPFSVCSCPSLERMYLMNSLRIGSSGRSGFLLT